VSANDFSSVASWSMLVSASRPAAPAPNGPPGKMAETVSSEKAALNRSSTAPAPWPSATCDATKPPMLLPPA
jgi:hypothetical protein